MNANTSSLESPKHYRVLHETRFEYSAPASLCHNTMRLRPRSLPYQNVGLCSVEISPTPAIRKERMDHHGNWAEYFSIESLHSQMVVRSECYVKRDRPHPGLSRNALGIANLSTGLSSLGEHDVSIDLAELRSRLSRPKTLEDRLAQEYCFDSMYIQSSEDFRAYAGDSFERGGRALDLVSDLTSRIYADFLYVPNSTLVSTTPREVLSSRQGVCQDFAHLQIACLRSLGLSARYVSGYLLTHPAPGEMKLVGADASHAWVSVYFGDAGWVDFDPTNNLVPDDEHITIAYGSDYADVAPIAGTLIGGGITTLSVSVDVAPVGEHF